MSRHDRSHDLAQFLVLTAVSTALALSATALALRVQRRRAERAAWAHSTDAVPPRPADAGH